MEKKEPSELTRKEAVTKWKKRAEQGEQISKESWFKRHLNLTMVLSWILALLFFITFGGSLGWTTDSGGVMVGPIINEAFGEWSGDIGILVSLIIVLLVTGWTLRKKNRSLLHLGWYLVFPLFFVGAIILLCLENRTEKF